MGWLGLVGSIKLQVSFAKEPHKTDCILQKRPVVLKSLLIAATPYIKTLFDGAPASFCTCMQVSFAKEPYKRDCILQKRYVVLIDGASAPLCTCTAKCTYGVPTVSSIDQIIGLFCRISSLLQVSFAKETYNFIDPTNQSLPIGWHSIL